MPIVIVDPGTGQQVSQWTIGDLAAEVIEKTEKRSSDLGRAYTWLRDAILEITANPDYRDDFIELEVWGPKFALVPGTAEYDFTNFVESTDTIDSTLDVLIWVDYPTNSRSRKLGFGHYQRVDTASLQPGLPSEWYRFGAQIGFNAMPDKAYQVQSRILKQHPINDAALHTTAVLLPRDWHSILQYAAIEHGWIELLNYQKAAEIHQLLHGDPKYPDKLGLIASRKKTRSKEAWRQQKALRPIIGRYGRR